MRSDNIEKFHATNRRQWRRWLATHHATAPGVWLISYKKDTGKPRVAYDEAVEEALCFGWIDSRPNKLDAEHFMQLFTPRTGREPSRAEALYRLQPFVEEKHPLVDSKCETS
jgi:uncharacterized protein YdeI (YjbR/CyaY-like superfamily)